MKLLFHSNAPWANTGYGNQTALFVPRLASLGHEIVISAFYGIDGGTTAWGPHLVLPKGQDPYGSDIIAAHTERTASEAVVTLMDAWVLDRGQIRDIRERLGVPVLAWLPVDTAELGEADEGYLRESMAFPVAMSKHGYAALQAKGLRCAYVPHGVDTAAFRPAENRDELRRQYNFEGRFSVGLLKANKDQVRGAYGEQLEAFRVFCELHPKANAVLSIHSLMSMPTGLNLMRLARRKGIGDRVAFNDQYAYTIGQVRTEHLASWLSALDILSITSYGEGFGIPIIEAAACGTPAVVNDCSAMTELAGAGWKVRGQKFHNEHHGEDWSVPFIRGIVRAYEKAYAEYKSGAIKKRRERARKFALRYDADLITRKYWVPVLAEIQRERHWMQRIGAGRDAAVDRLSRAWSAGTLDAETFGDRAGKALAAARPEDLEALTADLGDAA